MSMFETRFAACKICIFLRMLETLTYPHAKEVDSSNMFWCKASNTTVYSKLQRSITVQRTLFSCRAQATVMHHPASCCYATHLQKAEASSRVEATIMQAADMHPTFKSRGQQLGRITYHARCWYA